MSNWVKPPPDTVLTTHFFIHEAVCRHCGMVPDIDTVLDTAEWLEKVRTLLGSQPIHIASWCRCPVHNTRIGGAPQSYHLRGWAVDIVVRGMSPARVHKVLLKHWGHGKLIRGLGQYGSFTHIDRRSAPARWKG